MAVIILSTPPALKDTTRALHASEPHFGTFRLLFTDSTPTLR
jgi:hypothetical protein